MFLKPKYRQRHAQINDSLYYQVTGSSIVEGEHIVNFVAIGTYSNFIFSEEIIEAFSLLISSFHSTIKIRSPRLYDGNNSQCFLDLHQLINDTEKVRGIIDYLISSGDNGEEVNASDDTIKVLLHHYLEGLGVRKHIATELTIKSYK